MTDTASRLTNAEVYPESIRSRIPQSLTTLSLRKFLVQLSILFSSRLQKKHGSVHLSQKRLRPHSDVIASANSPPSDDLADLQPTEPTPLLLRATNGSSEFNSTAKVKFSTVVQPEDTEGFFVRYAEVAKAGMSGLKKRDRKKGKEKKLKKRKPESTSATKV